jgi:hypothetical protein
MENHFNESPKITSKEILDIISEYKTSSNKQLETVMDFIMLDFNNTKDHVIKLTNHLDKLEVTYNKILKEYKSRNGR